MKYYDVMTRNQVADTTLWAKIFTMYQNLKGFADKHENNVTFKLYQASGDKVYTEKNYYLSLYKGTSGNIIQFYDLDNKAGRIDCVYVLDEETGKIDVYAKGKAVDVPIKMKIIQSALEGRIEKHQWRGFEDLSDMEIVTPSVLNPYYTIEPISSESKFYRDTSVYKEYQDYYADRYKVRLKANLSVVNSSYSGSDEYLFTIPSQFVPTWAFEEGSEFIEFTQAYSYKKTGDATISTMRNYCRVKMFKNGQLKVDGTVALSDTITRLDLFLDIEYRRDVV